MPFIRVRGAAVGDPLHEFDIPVGELKRHPDKYTVIGSEPTATARRATFVRGVVKAPAKSDAATDETPSTPRPRKPKKSD